MVKQLVCFLFILLSFFNIESSVVELTDETFDSVFNSRKKGLVMFYSPGCGHCQRLKPVYEQLAGDGAITKNRVLIARVDCSKGGKETCSKYRIEGYPTLKFINREKQDEITKDYIGNRELNDLIKFALKFSLPSIKEVQEKEVLDFITSDSVPVVFGLFQDKKSPLFEKLSAYSAVNSDNFKFGYSFSKDVAVKLNKKMDCVVFYRQQIYKSPLENDTIVIDSSSSLENILDENKYSLVEIRSPDNEASFNGKMVVAFVGFDPILSKSKFKRVRNAMIKVASKYPDLGFFISKKAEYDEFINGFAPLSGEQDIHIAAFDDEETKYVSNVSGSYEDIKGFEGILSTFTQNYVKGDVYKRYIKSEPVPLNKTGYVTTVVGSTFDSIVLDDSKDVFIELYAPWCGHCKELLPKFEKLAKTLQGERSIIIAKMDATANDVHKNYPVRGFPTIYLAKGGDKFNPIPYRGERTLADMIKWLKENAKYPIQYVHPQPTTPDSTSDSKKEL